MLNVILVGAGGFLGSVLRYGAGVVALRLPLAHDFAYGTMLVNLLGCLAIGVLAGVVEVRPGLVSEEARLLLFVGLLGGFTTFSAFGLDTIQLMREGAAGLALINVAVQVVVGLAAVWAGLEVVRVLSQA